MKFSVFPSSLAYLAILFSSAHAAVITPSSATSTSYIGSGNRTIDKTIDGSGLSGGGTSGDVLGETHSLVYDDGNEHYWLSARDAGKTGNEILTFDLGGTHAVSQVHIWQYAIASDTRRQIDTAELTFSTDGGSTYGSATTVNFDPVSTPAPHSAQTRSFTPVAGVTHVKMQVNNGSDFIGLMEIRFGSPDTTPPALVPPTSPEDDATGVPVVSVLVATFDKSIALEDGGTIIIDDLDGGEDTQITLPDPRVSVSGAELVIEPDAPLAADTNHAVRISGDAVKDLAFTPNFFPGIDDATTWNFQTNADGTGPVIVPPTTPTDDGMDVATNAMLVAHFDESLLVGSGAVVIRNLTEGTETVIPVDDPQVTISGSTLTIDPAADLDPGDEHAVQIDAGAVTDALGNPFAGILDDETWNFTTAADTTAPMIVALSPADEGAVAASGSLVATFSEPVTVTTPTVVLGETFESGNGGFTVATTAGSDWEYGTPDASSPGGTINSGNGAVGGEGNCWGTKLGAYAGGTGDPGYYDSVTVPETVTCLRSAPIDLTTASGASLSFFQAYDLADGDSAVVNLIDDTTDTLIASAIYSVGTPATSGWDAAPAIDLADGLGEVVRIEWCLTGTGGGTDDYLGWYVDDVTVTATAAAGGIILKNLTEGTETVYAPTAPEVMIAGDTLALTPGTPLEVGDRYAVRISADAIIDLSGNPFAGILNDSGWNFTVASTLSLPVAADTYLRKNQGGTNQNGDPDDELLIGVISSGGDVLRPLLRFDTSALGALEDIDIVGVTLVGKNRDANGAGSALETINVHEYGFEFVEDGATWNDPAGDGSDPTAGGTVGATVATVAGHPTGANAQAVFTSNPGLVTLIEQAIAGDNTVNLLLKRDPEPTGLNSYARFQDEDQAEPFRLIIDYIVPGGSGGNTYADWIGGFAGLGGQTGLNDDPDGDGIVNGAENFFGTHPGEFSQGLISGSHDAGAGTFTFTHPQGAPADDLTATYRWSTDLATFHDDGVTVNGTTVDFSTQPDTPVAGTTTVTALITGNGVEKLFVSIGVTSP